MNEFFFFFDEIKLEFNNNEININWKYENDYEKMWMWWNRMMEKMNNIKYEWNIAWIKIMNMNIKWMEINEQWNEMIWKLKKMMKMIKWMHKWWWMIMIGKKMKILLTHEKWI